MKSNSNDNQIERIIKMISVIKINNDCKIKTFQRLQKIQKALYQINTQNK